MKKLVLCDMDGTLLDSKRQLPKELDAVIKALKTEDVSFGIASGRQYYRLRKQFSNYDDMLIIAENGASVYCGDENLFYYDLNEDFVMRASEKLLPRFDYGVVYAGLKGSYVHRKINEAAYDNTMMYCENVFFFDDLKEILNEDKIIKIACFVEKGNADEIIDEFRNYHQEAKIAVSAKQWIDINALDVSKGLALKKIKESYSLKDEDCYAFGDYDNDIELLKEAYHSYAMANAKDIIKEVARYTCPSNDDNGVIKTLVKEFKLEI